MLSELVEVTMLSAITRVDHIAFGDSHCVRSCI